MTSRSEDLLTQAMLNMDQGHEAAATRTFQRLEAIVRRRPSPEAANPGGAWDSFVNRLHWRGFLTESPEQLASTLSEIRELGSGFDLFDLARAIARYDVAVSECLRLSDRRLFPLLEPFAPSCDCGHDHPPREGGAKKEA
jgi:hypothetical protein